MDYGSFAVLSGLVVLYSLIAGRIERTLFGGAIFFTAAGFLLGPFGLDVLRISLPEGDGLDTLAELTLALLLFVDAASADLGVLRRSAAMPARLLLIGLPLTILAGFLAGLPLFPTLGVFEVALLATILAPTDAALGQAVVSDETLPDRIRTSLNFESGLNDGICVPVFLTFLAFALDSAGEAGFFDIALRQLVEEIGIGAVVGLTVAGLGAAAVSYCDRHGWSTEIWHQATVPGLALTCFLAAQAMGGSGFIASFLGGLVFGALVKNRKHALLLAAEGTGDVFALLTWAIFGAAVLGGFFQHLNWRIAVYAILSLTAIRMVPVWLAFRGSDIGTRDVLFVAWFGPRGLASIVFSVMAVKAQVPGADLIAGAVACTVLFSIVAHGLTARPFSRRLVESHARDGSA